MPRLGVANWPQLLVQKALPGQSLVTGDADVSLLVDCLGQAAREAKVIIHAYVVTPDHLHVLATPSTAEGLSLMMQGLGRRYVAGFNRRHGRRGGLWAGRYRSTVIEPARYLLDCMVFIEQHAVRAGRIEPGRVDPWSSAGHHLGLRTDPLIQDHPLFWALGNTPFEREAVWRQRLDEGLSAEQIQLLAQASHKGWALGASAFLDALQSTTDRRVQPRPRGRPRKSD